MYHPHLYSLFSPCEPKFQGKNYTTLNKEQADEKSSDFSSALLRSANHRRMPVNIELLLARHPLLFFGWECRVKGFDSIGVLTAVGGGGRNVHLRRSVADRSCYIDLSESIEISHDFEEKG